MSFLAAPLLSAWKVGVSLSCLCVELLFSLLYDIVYVCCILLCMFLSYVTVFLPVGVIKDNNNNNSLPMSPLVVRGKNTADKRKKLSTTLELRDSRRTSQYMVCVCVFEQ